MSKLVHCYCYYRIAPPHADAARATVSLALEALEDRVGVVGRLLRGESDPLLWMEVYENVRDADRLEAVLAEVLVRHRFSVHLAPGSERRMERFVSGV